MNVIDCIILAGIGILTVFAVLFALSILIRLISFTVHLQTPWKRHAKVSLSGHGSIPLLSVSNISRRSEERRVGKECRSRWSPYH